MQKIFFIAFLFCLISSCQNNTTTQQPVLKQEIPLQEKELIDAVNQFPDSTALKNNLIEYYQSNENYDKAMTFINNAIAKDTSNAILWDKKAEIYIYKEDTLNAIKCYETATNIFPNPEYIISLGVLYAYTKNPNALAIADALLIGKNAKAEKEAIIIKSIYLRMIGQSDKAIPILDACINMEYTYMPAYREKGIILYNNGKYIDAINVFNKAITAQNSFAEGYYWLGKCYEKLNKIDAAIESYKTALIYDNDYIEASDALGKLGGK